MMFKLSLIVKLFIVLFFLTIVSFINDKIDISGFLVKNASAITAEEMLSDPILEKRARNISAKLRCLVCQNQSIDESDAELAVDLRRQVREYLEDGMTNKQIFKALAEKYGEFVLLSPTFQPATYLLWGAPLLILAIGILLIANLFSSSKINFPKSSSDTKVFPELMTITCKQNKNDTEKNSVRYTQISTISRLALPVLILLLSVGIYLSIGSPDLIDYSPSDDNTLRAQAENELLEKNQLALKSFEEAKKRVEKNPDSLSAQFMLAATASQIGSIEVEISALKKALLLSEGDSRIKSQLAETLTRQANGQVTKAASNLISEVLKHDRKDIRALYLRGLELFQKGELTDAISYWKFTAERILPNSPLADKIRADVEQAAELAKIEIPNLTFSSVPAFNIGVLKREKNLINVDNNTFEKKLSQFATLSQNEQNQFIQQMTRRLLENLRQQPDNFDGWLKLAQAYLSISNFDLADDALISAINALSSEEQRISLIEFALLSHSSPKSIQIAGSQLSKISGELKNSFSVKFLQGEYARQIGDKKQAIRHWSDILNRMPTESNQAKTLQTYINSLENTSYGLLPNQ